ncbi:hypothetical protein [Afipia carboxidovorans]|uniref:hypothetical protein n=1 Tax=Afipia carboxidovorans TaxID=40137 RepID=UPI0030932D85|nr:hypothetical protein CRBSH125_08880 [Afipia carboxidovorans]
MTDHLALAAELGAMASEKTLKCWEPRHGAWMMKMREAASALRLAAQSPEPVTVKPLVWVDHRPDSFPEPAWSAQTPFGFYNIEEVSASDCPAYVVRLHAHRFVADKDSLDAAKAAAQADYEQRIRSALVNAPAVDGALREALKDLEAWCDKQGALLGALDGYDYHSGQEAAYRHTAIEIGKRIKSLAASEATKSDGGALPTNLAEIIELELMAWRGANGGVYTIRAAALGVSCAIRSAVFRAINTSSDGGHGGQPYASTDAVEGASAPNAISGKQEGRTGHER